MKIRIVSSKEEIETLENEEIVHFAFRPSNKDIFMLVKTCPKLKAIHIPNSYNRTISKSTLMFLDEELKNEGKSKEEIISKLGLETRLSEDLIKFLV